jgi:hypothetical protein
MRVLIAEAWTELIADADLGDYYRTTVERLDEISLTELAGWQDRTLDVGRANASATGLCLAASRLQGDDMRCALSLAACLAADEAEQRGAGQDVLIDTVGPALSGDVLVVLLDNCWEIYLSEWAPSLN